MTWNEFKSAVERELERQGAHGNFDISFIEIDGSLPIESIKVDTTDGFFTTEIDNY